MYNYVVYKNDHTKAIMAGASDFTGQFDAEVFEQIDFDYQQNGITVIPLKSADEVIKESRDQMAFLYKSAALSLRKTFSPVLSQVYSALDMADYELAYSLVDDVDTSALSEPDKTNADNLKAQFLAGLQALQNL